MPATTTYTSPCIVARRHMNTTLGARRACEKHAQRAPSFYDYYTPVDDSNVRASSIFWIFSLPASVFFCMALCCSKEMPTYQRVCAILFQSARTWNA